MKWSILLNIILVLIIIAYLLTRDPNRGKSVGIHGINSKNKIGKPIETDDTDQADSKLEAAPAKGATTTADKPKSESKKDDGAGAAGAAAGAGAASTSNKPKDEPAAAAGDDWDAAPAPAPAAGGDDWDTAPPHAASGGDDWDAAPPTLDSASTTKDSAPAAAPAASFGGDDWDAAPPALDDSATAAAPAAPASSGGDGWDAPPPSLDSSATATPSETPAASEKKLSTQKPAAEAAPTSETTGAAATNDAPAPAAPAVPASSGGDDWGAPPPSLDELDAAPSTQDVSMPCTPADASTEKNTPAAPVELPEHTEVSDRAEPSSDQASSGHSVAAAGAEGGAAATAAVSAGHHDDRPSADVPQSMPASDEATSEPATNTSQATCAPAVSKASAPAAPKPSGGDDWGTEPLPLDQLDAFARAPQAAAPAASAGADIEEPVQIKATATDVEDAAAADVSGEMSREDGELEGESTEFPASDDAIVVDSGAAPTTGDAGPAKVGQVTATTDAQQDLPGTDAKNDTLTERAEADVRTDAAPQQDAGSAASPRTDERAALATGDVPEGPFGPGSAAPNEDGSSPSPAFTIKGDADSMLFYTPDASAFADTEAEVWFASEDAAKAAMFLHWDAAQR